MASHVLPLGVSPIDLKTRSRRVTCCSVSLSCFSNAAFSYADCAAFAIFGKAPRIFFSAK